MKNIIIISTLLFLFFSNCNNLINKNEKDYSIEYISLKFPDISRTWDMTDYNKALSILKELKNEESFFSLELILIQMLAELTP